jgi:deoxyribodipyrimidine photolyase-related protein
MPLVKAPPQREYSRLVLIPGNCLFRDIRNLEPDGETLFFMAEDKGLCTRFLYHRHKLILLLSAMRSYRDWLAGEFDVFYYDIFEEVDLSYEEKLLFVLETYGISSVVTYVLEDREYEERIRGLCQDNGLMYTTVDSPAFMTTVEEFSAFREGKKKVLMNNFYISRRKSLGYLLDAKGNPIGGKWSLDVQNRHSLPKSIYVPDLPSVERSMHTLDVIEIVEDLFPSNPGNGKNFYIPTTREDALMWLDDFIENRLKYFGPYEDAIKKDEPFLFHSLLSPLMNIGLLVPAEVIGRALEYYEKNRDLVPLSSIEGFVRQVIGWREFMRGMYHGPDMKTNFFGHQRRLDSRWYEGKLGVKPVDCVISKVLEYGYCHHIERLMILGNFMLLCGIHPDEVYRWFMEMFVDAYQWVMVPNVYGMSQFADGGTLSTKPYISGSAYILRMSDHQRGDWCDVWDALYWRFIDKNRDILRSNFRMGMMVATYDRMENDKKRRMSVLAEAFLDDL